jgi:Flp pilus assembly protein TadG
VKKAGAGIESAARRGERGVAIIWLALFMLVLLGFGSLSVDVAKLAATKTQLQNAADAAALAGASALDPASGVIVTGTAVARAQAAAASNKAFVADAQPVSLNAGDVTFPTPTRIRVKVRREGAQSVVTTLAQVVGMRRLEVSATATAKVETTGTALCGLLPLGCSPGSGQDFQVGCQNRYTLKIGAGGSTGGGGRGGRGGGGGGRNETNPEGQYGALDFPACLDQGACAGMPPTGANTFRCLMTNGYCCPIEIGQVLNTESGNMSGPLRQAIDARFDADAVSTENICYSEYQSRGGTGQRVVFVPITTPVAGQPSVTVLGFATFFLRNRPGTGVESVLEGEFLYKVIPGTGGGSGSGAVAFSIRLVPN